MSRPYASNFAINKSWGKPSLVFGKSIKVVPINPLSQALLAIFVKVWKGHVTSNVLYGIHTEAGWENVLGTRTADHTWFFQIPLIIKAGYLPVYNLLYH